MTISRHQTLTQVSFELWLHALAGIEWSRSFREVDATSGIVPDPTEAVKERADVAQTQLWLQGQSWVRQKQDRRILTLLTHQVPRMTRCIVRAALKSRRPRRDAAMIDARARTFVSTLRSSQTRMIRAKQH